MVSAEVEMTAYGLLTYTLLGDVASALPVVKWLSQQRNSLGGFSSTQVTPLVYIPDNHVDSHIHNISNQAKTQM